MNEMSHGVSYGYVLSCCPNNILFAILTWIDSWFKNVLLLFEYEAHSDVITSQKYFYQPKRTKYGVDGEMYLYS